MVMSLLLPNHFYVVPKTYICKLGKRSCRCGMWKLFKFSFGWKGILGGYREIIIEEYSNSSRVYGRLLKCDLNLRVILEALADVGPNIIAGNIHRLHHSFYISDS